VEWGNPHKYAHVLTVGVKKGDIFIPFRPTGTKWNAHSIEKKWYVSLPETVIEW
jgi:hypothetical protein